MKRRKFLVKSALASTSLMIPGFLKSYSPESIHQSRSGKNLVVIQLSGGNDGLNTIVPYTNHLYYKARPTIAVQKNEVVQLSSDLGMHPSLTPMEKWFKEGYISIINGVGYPNPDRSHFRSMDIWHTASDSSEYLSTGWLGRYLDSNCEQCNNPHHIVELGTKLSLSLKGEKRNGFAFTNPGQLYKSASNPFLNHISENSATNSKVQYLYKTLVETQQSAKYIFEKSKIHKSRINYPQNPLANQLKQIAELMTADLDTKIYYCELGGFDTHANQKNTQQRLLKNLAEALDPFLQDLKENHFLEDTLIMVFSEFGRRVEQNSSNGTDHGAANNVWLISGDLKNKGFYNELPNLSNLDNGDLKYSVDFRNIYQEILQNQLDVSSSTIISESFAPLGII